MKKLLLFSLILFGVLILTSPSHAWYNASWQNRIKITFSGATTTENLSGYPVTVLLNSSRITYANASSSGSDNLRFVDPNDNTLLPYEVGYWNPSGTSTIFVKTNHVSSTQTDFIYMYYNNPSATSTASSTAVWDSNYLGVWHMSDAGTGVVKDSTANLNNGTEQNVTQTTSNWGKAENFDGASASTTFAKFPDNVTSSFSALVWVNTTLAARAAAIMGNEDWDADRNGFEIFMGGVVGSFGNELTTASAQYISANIASNSNNGLWQSLETTWQYGATSNVNFYINGINYYDPTVNGVVPVLNAYKVKLGANPGSPTPYWFNGAITEVRLSKVMRSPGWAVADWRNGMDTYNTYAAPESNGTAPIISSFTASPSSITSGVTSSLSWTITGATSASIDQGIGSVATSTGSTSVSPIITTTYTLTANNANGTITATTVVNVIVATGIYTNFDADLTPSTTNLYSIGNPVYAWKTIYLGDGSPASPSYTFADATNLGMFLAGANILGLSTAGVERMRIDSSGNVGIGLTSMADKLDVNGSAGNTTGVWATLSDIRLKKDINPINSFDALSLLTELQGVTFHWKDPQKDAEYGLTRGFIAQDVEKVLPEWVETDSSGLKSINPVGINALLVESIRELKKENDELKTRVKILENEINKE